MAVRTLGFVALAASCLAACAVPSERAGIREFYVAANVTSSDILRVQERAVASLVAPEPLRPMLARNSHVAQNIALWRAITDGTIGQAVPWSSAAAGDHGSVLVFREMPIPDSNRTCREFRQDGVIDGRPYKSTGQVCEQRDGSWALVSGAPLLRELPLSKANPGCRAENGSTAIVGRRSGHSGQFCHQRDGIWAMVQD